MQSLVYQEKCLSESITEYSLRQPIHPSQRIVLLLYVIYVLLFPSHYVINGVTSCLLVAFCLYHVQEETLTIIKDFGVQLKTKYWLGFENTLFIGLFSFCKSCLVQLIFV